MLKINTFSGLCGYVRGVIGVIQVRYPDVPGDFDGVKYYTRKEAVARHLLNVGERESLPDLVIEGVPWAGEPEVTRKIHTETLDKALRLIGYQLIRDTTWLTCRVPHVLAVAPIDPADRVGYRVGVVPRTGSDETSTPYWVGREFNSDEYGELLDVYDLVCSSLGAVKQLGYDNGDVGVELARVTSEIGGSDEVEFVPVGFFQKRLAALKRREQEEGEQNGVPSGEGRI